MICWISSANEQDVRGDGLPVVKRAPEGLALLVALPQFVVHDLVPESGLVV